MTASLWPGDHHFGGLDEGDGNVAFLQVKVGDGVGGDDGGDALHAERDDDLGEQAVNLDLGDAAEKLVAAADAAQR